VAFNLARKLYDSANLQLVSKLELLKIPNSGSVLPTLFAQKKNIAIFINQTWKPRQQMKLSRDLQPSALCISFIIVRNAWLNDHVHGYLYGSILIQPIFLHKCFPAMVTTHTELSDWLTKNWRHSGWHLMPCHCEKKETETESANEFSERATQSTSINGQLTYDVRSSRSPRMQLHMHFWGLLQPKSLSEFVHPSTRTGNGAPFPNIHTNIFAVFFSSFFSAATCLGNIIF